MRRVFSVLSFLLVACLCLLPQIATGEPLCVPVDHLTSFVGHCDTGTGVGLAMAGVAVPKGTYAKLKASIKQKLGLGDDKDAEVDALLAAEFSETDSTPTPTAPAAPSPQPQPTPNADAITQAVQAALAPIQQQVQGLTEALNAEKKARQTAQQALESQQAKERETAVTKALDEAVKAGKIAPAKRDDWKARLEKDFDGAGAILAELPGNPALAKTQQAATGKDESAKQTQAAKPESGTMLGGLRGDVLSYIQADA